MLLRSISSLLSSRAIPVLLLAMCLLSIAVVAGPTTDQVNHYSPDFREGAKNFDLEAALVSYTKQKKPTNTKFLRIGKTEYRWRYTRTVPEGRGKPYWSQMEEKKLGHFHFVNEIQADHDIEAARAHASEWPTLGDMVYWKFVNDMIMYLILCDAIDLSESTLQNFFDAVPTSELHAAYNDQPFLITLVLYRTRQGPGSSTSPRPTGQASLRIGFDSWLKPPRDPKHPIDSLNVDYIPVGYINKTVKVDLDALRTHAEKHTEYLQDGSKEGSKWISGLKKTTAEWEENKPSQRGGTTRRNYLSEWLYVDGIMDGLWEQKALDFPKSDWTKLRNDRMDPFINRIDGKLKESTTRKRKQQEISRS
ncbi:hypothetical protein F5880DRAFT_1505972 [Lentinula raphanica]|nr:hypothetical protein F5880DRAFT_1505972 [Lentinula raphanica]